MSRVEKTLEEYGILHFTSGVAEKVSSLSEAVPDITHFPLLSGPPRSYLPPSTERA